MLSALALAAILAIVNFFSEKYSEHVEKYHAHTLSFSAGLFLGIIFLTLLPEAFKGTAFLGQNVYLLMVSGFLLFHLGEKYIYQHIQNKDELLKDLASIHVMGFFFNHFVLGITLFLVFAYKSVFSAFLIFIPLLLHTFSSSLSLNHIDKHFDRKRILSFLLPLSPVLGVLFAGLLNLNLALYYGLLSFVIGSMLYIVIRDMVPKEQEGQPLLFVTGMLISILAATLLALI